MNDYREELVGNYPGWRPDKDGRLALLILIDQFPRKLFRGTAKAFATDGNALLIVKEIMDDQQLYDSYTIYEKMFILFALAHSEYASDTSRCLAEFEKLDQQTKENHPESYNGGSSRLTKIWINVTKGHDEVIQKFGRDLCRNAVLGRENTLEEEEYLKSAKTYGQ